MKNLKDARLADLAGPDTIGTMKVVIALIESASVSYQETPSGVSAEMSIPTSALEGIKGLAIPAFAGIEMDVRTEFRGRIQGGLLTLSVSSRLERKLEETEVDEVPGSMGFEYAHELAGAYGRKGRA